MNKEGVFPLVINGEFTPHIFNLILANLNSRGDLLKARKVSKVWKDFVDSETKIWEDNQIQCRAAIEGRVDIYKLIIHYARSRNGESQVGNNDNRTVRTPLHEAAKCGRLEICRLLIANIRDKNPVGVYGWTPLHHASEAGHLEVCQLILENVMVKNPSSQNGETPLHLAASNGHVNICQLIIDAVEEDKRNPPDVDGWTPLHCAAELGYLDVCRLIVSRVTNKHPVNAKGREIARGVGDFVYKKLCY